jgi:hypothetical protein
MTETAGATQPMRWAATLAAAALLISSGAQAQTPVCGADLAGAQRVESARYTVAYLTKPAKIAVAKHFSLIVAVCEKSGAPVPTALRIDARMPEHGHGMNYQAAIKPLGRGRFQVDGLMYHMPGRWELIFEVRSGDTAEQLLHTITL